MELLPRRTAQPGVPVAIRPGGDPPCGRPWCRRQTKTGQPHPDQTHCSVSRLAASTDRHREQTGSRRKCGPPASGPTHPRCRTRIGRRSLGCDPTDRQAGRTSLAGVTACRGGYSDNRFRGWRRRRLSQRRVVSESTVDGRDGESRRPSTRTRRTRLRSRVAELPRNDAARLPVFRTPSERSRTVAVVWHQGVPPVLCSLFGFLRGVPARTARMADPWLANRGWTRESDQATFERASAARKQRSVALVVSRVSHRSSQRRPTRGRHRAGTSALSGK